MQTEQLEAWRDGLGDAYTARNPSDHASRLLMWHRVLKKIKPYSILEVGANLGANLVALGKLTDAGLAAVEPNATARKLLREVLSSTSIYDATAENLPFKDGEFDLVFTCGVLIHIAPDNLGRACDEIHRVSAKYIVCIEYFSDKPETVMYRGLEGLLFKRDFGDFWMTRFPDLKIVDCHFFWRRMTGLDNLTAWVFEKGS